MALLKGTLDVLVLKALSFGPMHGFEITRWIEAGSHGAFPIEAAALLQALHRLEERRLLTAAWGVTAAGDCDVRSALAATGCAARAQTAAKYEPEHSGDYEHGQDNAEHAPPVLCHELACVHRVRFPTRRHGHHLVHGKGVLHRSCGHAGSPTPGPPGGSIMGTVQASPTHTTPFVGRHKTG